MKKDNTKSGYRILALHLLNSSFKRESIITNDLVLLKNDLKIEINTKIQDNKVEVTETIKYFSQNKNTNIKEVVVSVTMVGLFEKHGNDTPLELEKFGDVNGAAIIFPFIREHLSSLSLKAGIGNILLPPVNFVKMNIEKNKKKNID